MSHLLRRPRRFRGKRRRLAKEFLRGQGVEVGALNEPLQLPRGASVRYVDRMGVDDLRQEYPELKGLALTPVDVIDDGERLDSVAAESLDFIVANHFIEHTEDPIGTVARHLEKLREGGTQFMAVPDMRHTFDSGRELTGIEHLVRDYRDGPQSSRDEHYLEFARYFKKLDGAEAAAEAARVRETGYSIHFHVWTLESFRDLLQTMESDLGLPFVLEAIEPNHHEFIVILRKLPTLSAV